MGFDRLDRYAEPQGDLLVEVAASDQPQDLLLPRREQVQFRVVIFSRFSTGKGVQHEACQFG